MKPALAALLLLVGLALIVRTIQVGVGGGLGLVLGAVLALAGGARLYRFRR